MPVAVWAYLFYGLLIGAPLSMACLGFTLYGQLQIAELGAPSKSEARWFEGTFSRPAGARRTPLGAPVAAWFGVVQAERSSGRHTSVSTLCTLRELDGLELAGSAVRVEGLLLRPMEDAFGLQGFVRVRPGTFGLAGEVVRTENLPQPALSQCELPPVDAREKRFWIEHRLPLGAPGAFLGCRDEHGFRPCAGDAPGNALLVVGTRRDAIARMLGATLYTATILVGIALFFSFVSGGVAIVHLRRQVARRQS